MTSTLFLEAHDAFSAGQYQRACDLFRQVVERDPNNVRADYLRYVSSLHIDPLSGLASLLNLDNSTGAYLNLIASGSNTRMEKDVLIAETSTYLSSLIDRILKYAITEHDVRKMNNANFIDCLYVISRFTENRYLELEHYKKELGLRGRNNVFQENGRAILRSLHKGRERGARIPKDYRQFLADFPSTMGLADTTATSKTGDTGEA